jgi:peptidoglycan/xylan/chitin deacetylase (PgdA/CDA1 family)
MDPEERQARRQAQRQARIRRRRATAAVALAAVVGVVAVIALASGGGGGDSPRSTTVASTPSPTDTTTRTTTAAPKHRTKQPLSWPPTTASPDAPATGHPGHAAVPVLMYHVIADPLPGVPYPGLYVPVKEFKEQMKALKDAGWHAVTQDQLLAHWRHGASLGKGKPIVLTFDNGYHSQEASAMPILRKYHWAGVENIQLTGLPPSQGGLTRKEVKKLLTSGWELDTQGISHADLVTLSPQALEHEVADARRTLQHRYKVQVNWFCYPSGHYDATVIDEVKHAGFVGSTTVIPGWAHGDDDRYTLPRLRVLGGTSGTQLLTQIATSKDAGPTPASYTAAG